MIIVDKVHRHIERCVGVALGAQRDSRRPHALWNDCPSLTDDIVKQPSIDGKGRTSTLHGKTRDKKSMGAFLGDGGTKRLCIHTQETCEEPYGALWGECLGNVSINEEIHLQSSGVKTS